MRTKTLICAAALAAGALTSWAQSNVYSLNVVGYVNVPLVGGAGGGTFTMIANPLNRTDANGNNITNLFKTPGNFDQIYRWNPLAAGGGDFSGTIYTYSSALNAWDGNFVLAPGEGIFYLKAAPGNSTNTFVGDVIQGAYTNPGGIVGGVTFNAKGSSAPIGGSFTNSIAGLVPSNFDQVYTWNTAAAGGGDFSGSIATYSTALNAWDTTAINVDIGIGFMYLANGANQTWVRNFTVQ